MPSNYQIFEYWKDKMLNGEYNSVICDDGEPSCWACGKPIQVETQQLLDECNFKEIWNRTSGQLQRCHIIPKALGGSNEVDNLFLMCSDCHEESPNIMSKDIFLSWVTQQRKDCVMGFNARKFNEEIERCCSIHNVGKIKFMKFVDSLDLTIIADKINTHRSKVNYSTVIYAWMNEYLHEN